MEGPELWIIAKEAYTWSETTVPVVTHGAGVWLVDEKAKKARNDERMTPRLIFCEMVNDSAAVILEAAGTSESQ